MKKLLLAGAALLAFTAGPTFAADMAVKAPIYKAPPAPVWSWTGFYVGGNIGYSWGRSSGTTSFNDATTGTALAAANANFDMDGVIGGGQFGYNWQSSNWVFGFETDIQGSGQKGNTNTSCAGGSLTSVATLNGLCTLGHQGDTAPFNVAGYPVSDNLSEKLDWLGTVRGRIGPTITPTVLAYVTGGLAYGQVSTTSTVSSTNILGAQGTNSSTLAPVAGAISNSTTRVGWTIGGGFEGVIGGNWTAKIEYLYVDLGSISGSFVTPVISPSGNFVAASYNSHVTDNILRVGINYKFDAGGPVVARY